MSTNLRRLQKEIERISKYTTLNRECKKKLRRLATLAFRCNGQELNTSIEMLVDTICSKRFHKPIARDLMYGIGLRLDELPDRLSRPLLLYILAETEKCNINFVREIASLKLSLSKIFVRNREWRKAAELLTTEPIKTGKIKAASNIYKISVELKIALLYATIGDAPKVKEYLDDALQLQTDETPQRIKNISFSCIKQCARLLEYKDKFLTAATLYKMLSQSEIIYITHLESAFNCAVLAPVGVARSQMLVDIYADEHAGLMKSSDFLEKLFHKCIIPRSDWLEFKSFFPDDDETFTNDVDTKIENAMLQHNISVISALHKSISLEEISKLIEINDAKTLRVISKMFADEQLHGRIDLTTNTVHFEQCKVLPMDLLWMRSV